jgi:hypothetical protein
VASHLDQHCRKFGENATTQQPSMRNRLAIATLTVVLAFVSACKPKVTRNNSSLIHDLSGVWTYSLESGRSNGAIPDSTTVTMIDGMNYIVYEYGSGRYSEYRRGEIVGQEGVYFFQNEASYYSPKFFVENNGRQCLILNKFSYDKFVKSGQLNAEVEIKVAEKLDFHHPPPRVSVETMGLPYYDDYAELRK